MLRRSLAAVSMVLVTLALLVGAVVTECEAQIYPTRPVRIVVGFPAGSASDVLARIYADKLTEYFNQRFLIDNIVGGASNDAAAVAARAEPDGYTLFLAGNAQSAHAAILPEQPFAFPQAFAPIAMLGRAPVVLVVNRSLGVSSVAELIALAKARPGVLHYGSAGVGTGPQIAAELFKATTGVDMVHVSYAGSHDAAADLVAGRLSVLFAPLPTVAGLQAERRILTLAIVGARRSPAAPQIPTLAEAGFTGIDVGLWFGLMAPRGIPTEIQGELANAVKRAIDSRLFKENLLASGAEPVRAPADAFAAFLDIDLPHWAELVGRAGVGVEQVQPPAQATRPTQPASGL
ncbi:tripartite tricarboxylate transporter substrate binding protein [Rhodoplanes serenus]|uniref:Tripartite tricarboxylate transporter substrate binding protein n=1 Tax=Rhodoplanes serenus TaxID=200615 RepID=A0A9X5ASD0_9BRAD|nr:tripartite tricarboxylate transporter substrate binding protein [Rhodoplanes serenus]